MKISSADKAHIYKQLSVLLKSGVSLSRALKILAVWSNHGPLLLNTAKDLESGKTLSRAMNDNNLLPGELVQTVRIAEENAFLEEIFEKTAALFEKKDRHIKNLKKALTYPCIVFGLSVFSILFLLCFVLPSYSRIFSDLNCKLPPITQFAVALPNYSFMFFALIVAFFAGAFKVYNDVDFRMGLPVLGEVFRLSFLSEFCFSLSCQLKSGVPLVYALKNLKVNCSKNVEKAIFVIVRDLENGASISDALSRHKIFFGALPQIVKIGEEAGSLSQMLFSAGENFMETSESELLKFSALVEPAATLAAGGAVAFVAFAMLMPLFSIVNSLL